MENGRKGVCVSAQHQQFVEDRVEQQERRITVLPACVDTSLFNILERRGPIRLVYHGRMDRHRGIDTVLRLFKSLENKNGEFELYLHGKGPMYEKIRSQAIDNVTVTGRLERAEVAERLATYDIGLLPMPPRTIWKLASPLKRAEYLGSGLCVLGIDHEGHRLPDRSPATFMKLYPQSEFLEQAQAWLSGLKRQAPQKSNVSQGNMQNNGCNGVNRLMLCSRLFVNKSRPTFWKSYQSGVFQLTQQGPHALYLSMLFSSPQHRHAEL